MTPLPHPCLMLVTEPAERLEATVAAAVAGGVNAVQLRDKAAPPGRLHETGARLRQVLGKRALLVVNGLPNLAREIGADGVHLPEAAPWVCPAWQAAGEAMLLSRSVHSVESARRAAGEGADYLLAGTVFASSSHPNAAPVGLDLLHAVCAAVSIPVIAIGGITPQNAGHCLRAGAAGVAALSSLMRAGDSCAAAQAYRAALATS